MPLTGFDLGITITVAGRRFRSPTCSLRAAVRDPYLLLADGALLPLQEAELQALSRLIEEALSPCTTCLATR